MESFAQTIPRGENMEEQEEWRKIDPPFSRYSVSNLGRVRNDNSGYVFIGDTESKKYPRMHMVSDIDGKRHNKYIHVIVAQQFLNYTPEMQKDLKIVVHHKDDNKLNTKLENLEIISQSENMKLRKPYKKRGKTILQYDIYYNFIEKFNSISDIIYKFPSYNKYKIYKCCDKKIKQVYNSIWEYEIEDDLENEKWINYEINNDILKISNMGRIIDIKGNKTFGNSNKNNDGYRTITINKNAYNLHRLICQAFHPIDNPENFVVNHINHIKNDNRAENLEWATPLENNKAYVATNPDYKSRKLTRKPVVAINDKEILHFNSVATAAEQLGINKTSISHALKGIKSYSCGGYTWLYQYDYNCKLSNGEKIKHKDGTNYPKPVINIMQNGEVKYYETVSQASKDIKANVSNIIAGRLKIHDGSTWMYLSDYEKMACNG